MRPKRQLSVKSILLPCRGLWFSSQRTHGSFQPSVTPVPGYRHPFLAPKRIRHTHGAHACMQAKLSHTQNEQIFKKKFLRTSQTSFLENNFNEDLKFITIQKSNQIKSLSASPMLLPVPCRFDIQNLPAELIKVKEARHKHIRNWIKYKGSFNYPRVICLWLHVYLCACVCAVQACLGNCTPLILCSASY